jgi:tetratricopeptide (TPR) repeat protein
LQSFKRKNVFLLALGLIIFSGIFSLNLDLIQAAPTASLTPSTPFVAGMSYFGQGEYDKAIIEFEKSIQLDPNQADSYYYLGQCYLEKGIIQYNNKNILKAYSLYRKAYEISEQAIIQYEKKIEENPVDFDAYIKLGYIYETRSLAPFIDEYDKALNYFFKALEIFPENTWVLLNIGFIYLEKEDYHQAIDHFEKAEKISPQNTQIYYYLGLSYDKIGEKEKAVASFSKVIEIAPDSNIAGNAKKELEKISK